MGYRRTLRAGYIGYVTQAIVNNFAPLLFITFHTAYAVPFDKIALLITVNFAVQFAVDLFSVKYADKIGYRKMIVAAHICAGLGLAGLGLFPLFLPPYPGLILAVVIYAVGGGIIEVLISPIVEACPTQKKSAEMSLLHSFYCWGQVFVVLGSTLFFAAFGVARWPALACLWAVVPLLNAVYFTRVPIYALDAGDGGMPVKQLFSMKTFRIFILLMACAGAAELSMAQWASAFAEAGLGVSKAAGDLAGPCAFAVLMGVVRAGYSRFSEKINLRLFMALSCCLGVLGYLLAAAAPRPALSLIGCGICGIAAGILWPGTFSLAAEGIPSGGTSMFALLALAGDLGCSTGPTAVGFIAEYAGGMKAGLLAAAVFPAIMAIGLFLYKKPAS